MFKFLGSQHDCVWLISEKKIGTKGADFATQFTCAAWFYATELNKTHIIL